MNGDAEFFEDETGLPQVIDVVTVEGIRRGLEQIAAGEGRPFEEFFKEFRAKYGIAEEDSPWLDHQISIQTP